MRTACLLELSRLASAIDLSQFSVMENVVSEMISRATITIALFVVVSCLMQQQFRKIYSSFALFLVAVAVNNLPSALGPLLEAERTIQTHFVISVIAIVSALCLAPFFWIYVFTLTSNAQSRPPYLAAHLFLPVSAFTMGLILALSVPDLWTDHLAENYVLPDGFLTFLGIVLSLTAFAVYLQLPVYIILILNRLLRYRRRLRDLYASTEQHELNWIYVIGILGVLFWMVQVLALSRALGFESSVLQPAIFPWVGFALFTSAALWGLRQRPGLIPDGQHEEVSEETIAPAKYQKSALTQEASVRIERKLRAAMEADHLYRDPNLSLWVLARHVGASPNYISQTLNQVVKQSFFDFVNDYRIADAKYRLAHTNDTVLTIAYDVGFNTRSSFYSAFKRVTGLTPVVYRKNESEPMGLDDTTAQSRET